jgi:glycosyltransferase involved in cell wall biosynthesis
LDEASYFPVGDTQTLAHRLHELAAITAEERALIAKRLVESCVRYDWDAIAESTLKVLERVAGLPAPVAWPETRPARPN